MSTLILINTTTIVYNGSATQLNAGDRVSDSSIQDAAEAEGAIFGPTSDDNLVAASALVAKLRSKGRNEQELTAVMMAAYASTAYATAAAAAAAALPTNLVIDVPLATLQGKTSGTAFNIGAALPAGAVLSAVPTITVVAALAGTGPITQAHAEVEPTGAAGGALIGSTDVLSATGTFATAGSNPNPAVGGDQLQMTVTTVGGAMAALTAGHLQVNLNYTIPTT